MKYYGLYFISTPTNNAEASTSNVDALVQGIESSFPVATRHTPWSLQYRVFRDTIPPGTATTDAEGKPKPFAHAYQHLLYVSSLDQSTTYICTRPPGGKAIVTGIPLRQQEAHASLVRNQFAALWQLRHILSVQQGITYNAGLCTIQLGVLRAAREGPQSGVTPSPGVVVCISTNIGSDEGAEEADAIMENGTTDTPDEPLDFEYAQTIIRDCWSQIKTPLDLGRSEIKEIMMDPEVVKGVQENEAAVRIWAEVLRLRG